MVLPRPVWECYCVALLYYYHYFFLFWLLDNGVHSWHSTSWGIPSSECKYSYSVTIIFCLCVLKCSGWQDNSKEDFTFLHICRFNLWLPMLPERKSNLRSSLRRLLVSELAAICELKVYNKMPCMHALHGLCYLHSTTYVYICSSKYIHL